MRTIIPVSRQDLEKNGHRLPSAALITFRDAELPPAKAEHTPRLDLVMNDIAEPMANLLAPAQEHAQRIRAFVAELRVSQSLIIQCEAGLGRSMACAAALLLAQGDEAAAKKLLRLGTHNRRLYRLLCAEFGLQVPAEPLVALAVRVKYPNDRAEAFLLSLRRQRYTNWRCVFVTDGPMRYKDEFADQVYDTWDLIETSERRGLWGHPYRHVGIAAALGWSEVQYVGLNNDDNYLTPGYIEQLVNAAQDEQADLVLCRMLHAYSGWGVVASDPVAGCADVGNWIASADLIRQVKFDEYDFLADGRFVERLAAKAKKVARVEKPLLCKN